MRTSDKVLNFYGFSKNKVFFFISHEIFQFPVQWMLEILKIFLILSKCIQAKFVSPLKFKALGPNVRRVHGVFY